MTPDVAAFFYEEPSRRCACGAVLFMSPTYDALACLKCDKWAEPGCGDKACWAQCATRPPLPSGVTTADYKSAVGDNGRHYLHRMYLRIGGWADGCPPPVRPPEAPLPVKASKPIPPKRQQHPGRLGRRR